jgi:hypothetical protein
MPLALDKEDDNQISVEGSRADMEQLAQFIADPQAFRTEQLLSNFELNVRATAGNVIIRRSRQDQIVIEGGQDERETLADNLRSLLDDGEGSLHTSISNTLATTPIWTPPQSPRSSRSVAKLFLAGDHVMPSQRRPPGRSRAA